MNYAIDREAIAESLYSGAVEPTAMPVFDGFDPTIRTSIRTIPRRPRSYLRRLAMPMALLSGSWRRSPGAWQVLAHAGSFTVPRGCRHQGEAVEPTTQSELFEVFLGEEGWIFDYPNSLAYQIMQQRWFPGGSGNPNRECASKVSELLEKITPHRPRSSTTSSESARCTPPSRHTRSQ